MVVLEQTLVLYIGTPTLNTKLCSSVIHGFNYVWGRLDYEYNVSCITYIEKMFRFFLNITPTISEVLTLSTPIRNIEDNKPRCPLKINNVISYQWIKSAVYNNIIIL